MSEVTITAQPRAITIGTAQKDAELLGAILQYQEENKILYTADAVRDLCKYALEVKKVK